MKKISTEEYLTFLMQILEATFDSDASPEVVYPLLQANLDKLDENFAELLLYWGKTNSLEASTDEAEFIATTISEFSNLIQQFPLGNKATSIEIAINGYLVACNVFNSENFPEDWAINQINLGIAYNQRIKGDLAENKEQALAICQNALSVFTQEDFPIYWATIKLNIGRIYYKRIKGDKAENLEISIANYNNALCIYNKKEFPFEWANIQNSIANAYSERIRGDRAENLERAIYAYEKVLSVYTRESFPIQWATTQNNLASTYSDRIRGDRAQNIENAIAAHHLALSVRTKKDFPIDWATTQNNLANAYSNRIGGDKAENLENAIAAFHLALEVYTPEDFPIQWATTQNNLANAYSYRIRGDKAENLENAIAAFHLALQVRTKEDFPIDWATTQNNLANAYRNRISDDWAENLERAINAFELALLVYTREDFPIQWAITQNNLANAYTDRIRGDWAENLERAINAFELALLIRTPEVDPIECLRTSRSLGNLHFKEGNWRPAITAYEKAITAVELSRSWSTDDDRRQEILAPAIEVYQNIVQACVNTNQIEKALEYVERSRSRRLVDLMASNDLYSKGEIPAEVQEWLEKHEAIQQQINQLWEQQRDSYTEGKELAEATRRRAATEARNQHIAELEAQKQEVYKKIRSLDRILAEGIQLAPLEFEKIQALIQQPTTAILSFYTTKENTYLFVVRQNGVKVYIYSGLGLEKLQDWIWENWFMSYLSSYHEWQQQMPGFLEYIGKELKLEDLCKSYLQDIEELILIPYLYLHFLPWSAMPVAESSEKKYLGDYFRIRTLASCQILDFCTQRPEVTAAKYGIVEDTRNDLPCSSYETQHIAKMYGVPDNRRLRGQAATVESYKLLLSQVTRLLSTHHAQSRIDNCMESGLILADGRITLGQLLSPAWRFPDLEEVFLSSCETNIGTTNITDDIMTLNTGFLCVGARTVVSTLWSVDDLATSLLSIFYHQNRRDGKNSPEALRVAQQKLRQLTGKELKKRYKKELEIVLEQKLEEAYQESKEAQVRRNSYAKDSAEYQELEEEQVKLNNIYQRIYYTKNRHLKAACKEEYPFEHPVYWSAFICSGLS